MLYFGRNNNLVRQVRIPWSEGSRHTFPLTFDYWLTCDRFRLDWISRSRGVGRLSYVHSVLSELCRANFEQKSCCSSPCKKYGEIVLFSCQLREGVLYCSVERREVQGVVVASCWSMQSNLKPFTAVAYLIFSRHR